MHPEPESKYMPNKPQKQKSVDCRYLCMVLMFLALLSPCHQAIGQIKAHNDQEARRLLQMAVSRDSLSVEYKELVKIGNSTYEYLARHDATHSLWIGSTLHFNADGEMDLTSSMVINQVFNETGFMYLDGPAKGPPFKGILRVDEAGVQRRKGLMASEERGGPMNGRIHSMADKTIAQIVLENPTLKMTDQPEVVAGQPCRLIEAITPYGHILLWIEPAYGQLLKFRVTKKNNQYGDKTAEELWPDGGITLAISRFEATSIDKKTGLIASGRFSHTLNFEDGTKSVDHYTYQRSQMVIKDSFDKDAFKYDLPEGLRIEYLESFVYQAVPGVSYEWRDGKIQTIVTLTRNTIDSKLDDYLGALKGGQASSQADDDSKEIWYEFNSGLPWIFIALVMFGISYRMHKVRKMG